MLQLARLIRINPLPLRIFTNGLAVAQEFLNISDLEVVLLGGQLRSENASLVGPQAEAMLESIWFDQLFLGASAIGPDGAIYSVDSAEANLNRCMLTRSAHRFVLADSSKFGTDGDLQGRAADRSECDHRRQIAGSLAQTARRLRRRDNDRRATGQSHERRSLILGIDGGGSKVFVALADRTGRIVHAARGGGVNPMDNRNWQQELHATLCSFAIEPGLAGVAAALPAYGEVERISQSQREAIAAAFAGYLKPCSTMSMPRISVRLQAAPVSSSSPAPARWHGRATRAGRSYRVGGWGDVIGDEGSSYWIGRRALGLVSQSLDGRASSERAGRRGVRAPAARSDQPDRRAGGLGVRAFASAGGCCRAVGARR